LIQIKQPVDNSRHASGLQPEAQAMTTPQFYYLLLVILAFGGFGVAVAANYITYRGWRKTHPLGGD
jgi:hypothetical protein